MTYDQTKGDVNNPCRISLAVTAVDLGVGVLIAALVVWELGGVAQGEAIRPMGLVATLFYLSALAFVFSLASGLVAATAAPSRRSALGWGTLVTLTGLTPLMIGEATFFLMVAVRSLELKE